MLIAIAFQWSFDLPQRPHSPQHHHCRLSTTRAEDCTVWMGCMSSGSLHSNQSWTQCGHVPLSQSLTHSSQVRRVTEWSGDKSSPLPQWTDHTFEQFSPPLQSQSLWARFVQLSTLFNIEVHSDTVILRQWRVPTIEQISPTVHAIAMEERNVQGWTLLITDKTKTKQHSTIDAPEVHEKGPLASLLDPSEDCYREWANSYCNYVLLAQYWNQSRRQL